MAQHPIVHIEIPGKDIHKTMEFYRDLFGWQMQDVPEMNYITFRADPGPGGGFPPASDEYPVGKVLIYVGTDDIEGDLQKADQLGGKIIAHKMEIPGTGWFGVFEDKDGNKIGLYTPMEM